MELSARVATLRLAETFTISRGTKDEADVVQVELTHDGVIGFGEAAPIARYDESADSALEYLEENADALGDDPFALDEIAERLPRGQFAAREEFARQGFETEGDRGQAQFARALAGVADQRLMPTMQAVESSDANHAALRAEVLARDVPEQLSHGKSIASGALRRPANP